MENKLREHELDTLLENATVGIISVNAAGEITLVNRFVEAQFGYARAELLGNKIEMLLPESVAASHVRMRENFTRQPQNRPMGIGLDLQGKRKDGTTFPVEISLSHFQTADGLSVIAFINDITIRKQHEKDILNQQSLLETYSKEVKKLNQQLEQRVEERTLALRETLQQLERSNTELEKALSKEKELSDLKSRFVSMASHEFRTPLSTILSSATLIGKYVSDSEQEKRNRHILRIQENVKNLTDILEDFLSLGKLEEGLIQPKYGAIEIQDFIKDIVHDLDEVKKPQQQINYTHDGDEQCMSDMHLLKNIIINLTSNAIKFSPEDGVIQIHSAIEDYVLTIEIKDDGIGISKEDQQYLFDRFFRGRNAANIKGTGLGLHIVAQYIQLLHGSIVYKTELNYGTQFTISIPQPKS